MLGHLGEGEAELTAVSLYGTNCFLLVKQLAY